MAEFKKVSQWFETGELVHPLSGRSIVDVSRELVADTEKGINVVFVLLDGFGLNLLESLDDCFLKRNFQHTARSVFPATTAAALSSWGSGVHPSSHGITGWTMMGSDCLPFNPLVKECGKSDISYNFGFSSIWDKIDESRSFSFYRDSKFSKAMVGSRMKGKVVSADDVEEGLAEVAAFWKEDHDSGSFSYVYCKEPDALQHQFGIHSEKVIERIKLIDSQIANFWENQKKLNSNIPRKIVISADHGQLNGRMVVIGEGGRMDQNENSEEIIDVDVRWRITGEARTPIFWFNKQFPCLSGIIELLRMRIGETSSDWAFITPKEAEELELFGPAPYSEATIFQLGHLIGITKSSDFLVVEPNKLIGMHGGARPEEMLVPVISALIQ